MPRAFRQRIGIRKRKPTTRRITLMRHNLSYGGRLKSSNAKVAFVRANFTAGRGHAWKGDTSSSPLSRDCGTKAGHFPTARCCNGTNVARSTADVGEAVLSISSSAAAFSSVHRDNG